MVGIVVAEQIIAPNNNRRAQQLLLDFQVTQFKQAIPKCHDTFGFSCAVPVDESFCNCENVHSCYDCVIISREKIVSPEFT